MRIQHFLALCLIIVSVYTCNNLETQTPDPVLSWKVPADVAGGLQGNDFDKIQAAVNLFTWETFIAINWPALPNYAGVPDSSKTIAATGPRVWETWKEASEVYLPNGQKPSPWGQSDSIPGLKKGIKVLSRWSKNDEFLNDDLQPTKANGALPGTLTDQNGNIVYYEIRLNQTLFDYVVKNQFYNSKPQAQAKLISAPAGSMLIKAAWRQLKPGEGENYLVINAYVSDNPDHKKAKYQLKRMGLVGLHVMHKTPSAPQWIWSTHEQTQNLSSIHPTFYNPNCDTCPINKQTQPGTPNQVKRAMPIASATQALNKSIQVLLNKAKLSHYELIGAQWPIPPSVQNSNPSTVFAVAPSILANSTMETFIQKSSSCMGCHAMARSSNPDQFVSADFSFTFSDAQPTLSANGIALPPKQNGVIYPPKKWQSIMLGYNLTIKTYEMLPQNVPVAKLHCGSCHLDAGTNPSAAWWVGMRDSSNYPTLPDITKRINQCFTNSLNGIALCPDTATNNVNMNALIDYMSWLDTQAKSLPKPLNPFPTIPVLTPDTIRGKKIFLQKCAFCHQRDGQGRYASNTYYRPALWGAHSYNQSAGFYGHVDWLAAFIHGNMPLGSGGVLTAQEATDLAYYIKGKPRPRKTTTK